MRKEGREEADQISHDRRLKKAEGQSAIPLPLSPSLAYTNLRHVVAKPGLVRPMGDPLAHCGDGDRTAGILQMYNNNSGQVSSVKAHPGGDMWSNIPRFHMTQDGVAQHRMVQHSTGTAGTV